MTRAIASTVGRALVATAALTSTTLAVMNGRTAAEPPRSGERLKIVVTG